MDVVSFDSYLLRIIDIGCIPLNTSEAKHCSKGCYGSGKDMKEQEK